MRRAALILTIAAAACSSLVAWAIFDLGRSLEQAARRIGVTR